MLFFHRKFFPFFITQFLGAFNDNLFKNAMLIFFAMHIQSEKTLSVYTNLSAGLFILPMFLCSAWSGLLAERIEKRRLILWVKGLEVFIMLLGIAAFCWAQKGLMMLVLCLLGLQSTFFGPVKYGILPERLLASELMLGNGIVEAGTFLAILTGTLLGAALMGAQAQSALIVVMLMSAGGGLIAAYFIPKSVQNPKIMSLPPWQPWQQTRQLLQETVQKPTLFYAILAISWFWLLGGGLLTQIPQYARDILGGNAAVMTYLLVLFSVGVGAGSLAVGKWSRGRIDMNWVSIGALLLCLGLGGLVALSTPAKISGQTLTQLMCTLSFWGTSAAFLLIAFAGGIYVVPLYALIQQRAPVGYKSQMIAANNILNALFLVAVSICALVVLGVFNGSLQDFFCLLFAAHALVSLVIVYYFPDALIRAIARGFMKLCYRFEVRTQENLRFYEQQPVIFVANHVSYIDPIAIVAALPKIPRFVMYYKIFNVPVLNWFFKSVRAIPIAGRHEDAHYFQQSFEQVHHNLQTNKWVGIFPEGRLSSDGKIAPFKRGVALMLAKDPVTVIPIHVDNLWGSFFSRKYGLCRRFPRTFRRKVVITIGKALPANAYSADELERAVCLLAPTQNE